MPKRTTLTEEQKSELCAFARINKKNQSQYVDWIENKWGLRVDESTISHILKTSEERLDNGISNSKTKRHRAVTYPELDLALKEFVLIYQHRTVFTRRKSEGTLNFSPGWLYKFKNRNGIRLRQLQGKAASANIVAINNIMPSIKNKCASYPPERIYNMDETGLFYRYKSLINANSDLRSSLEDFCQTTNPVLNDIADALNALDLLDPIQVEEYLAIPEENIVYEVPSNDQVITELVETFRTNEPTNIDLEDEDDSFEAPIVSANMAIASLETMRTFLLQQDCIEGYVNLVRRIEKFIKKTKVGQIQQSRIDQFFVEDN
ncbi:2425_t:CDS:2 [Racocetra persica]|uniref:2425_t:CDS:1 n=1 Tax=Racocetra persica TaxID=160502 RepID=A0ACA9LXT3_9GLOM|nr:2425_t:CDS:2 [Racocetra persica]